MWRDEIMQCNDDALTMRLMSNNVMLKLNLGFFIMSEPEKMIEADSDDSSVLYDTNA